jgi:hypothetical protein
MTSAEADRPTAAPNTRQREPANLGFIRIHSPLAPFNLSPEAVRVAKKN